MRLLAILLLMQWAGAVVPHARAMERAASAQRVELCTHDGQRSILLDENGKPVQPAPATDCCSLCQWAMGDAPPGPAMVIRAITFLLAAEPFRHPGLPHSPPRSPPHQPRAPPHA
ncbi:DUF2946 family protein [Roseomonas populi]|uniref:DUF2946 domain-containing protein n=1 Tax=Roseomonas populi TaxID=3121582 RepID=A0ABT1X3H1_9PROT|nr:DUF2946 family protein [Roseomonas pecuniae]MCR0982648.1 hypothetical protein [Roseomonas pecuniae]